MKIAERMTLDGGRLYVEQRHNLNASLAMAERMRHAHEAGHTGTIPKDWVPLGVVPGVLVRAWADEAGVRMDDSDAMNELLNRKLLSGEFSKFRVSEKT